MSGQRLASTALPRSPLPSKMGPPYLLDLALCSGGLFKGGGAWKTNAALSVYIVVVVVRWLPRRRLRRHGQICRRGSLFVRARAIAAMV